MPGVAALIVGVALLVSPRAAQAQRGGGGGGGSLGSGAGPSTGRPDGVSDKDGLKDFHRAMAIQATPEQRAAFAKIAQYTEDASDRLRGFLESLRMVPAPSSVLDPTTLAPTNLAPTNKARAAAVGKAIESARGGNQKFLASFSAQQKSGLQDSIKKLEKADSELDKQIKTLDQIVQMPKADTEQISSAGAGLDKVLTSYQNEQLALGREMSILFDPAGQGATFSLATVTNLFTVDGQAVSIPASGAVSRVSTGSAAGGTAATPAETNSNLFSVKLVADLTSLQQNITGLLRSRLDRSPSCGERITVQEATLNPLAPASLVVATLHFERWVCGQGSPMEVAGSEGTIEVKLTPSLDPTTGLHLGSEITRVEAQGLLRSSLRSGDLGVTLREQIAATFLAALQKGADLKAMLPSVAQQSTMLQKAEFQDAGTDELSLILDGQVQLSKEQTEEFAAQLKQRLSAQGTAAGGTTPQ